MLSEYYIQICKCVRVNGFYFHRVKSTKSHTWKSLPDSSQEVCIVIGVSNRITKSNKYFEEKKNKNKRFSLVRLLP